MEKIRTGLSKDKIYKPNKRPWKRLFNYDFVKLLTPHVDKVMMKLVHPRVDDGGVNNLVSKSPGDRSGHRTVPSDSAALLPQSVQRTSQRNEISMHRDVHGTPRYNSKL